MVVVVVVRVRCEARTTTTDWLGLVIFFGASFFVDGEGCEKNLLA